MPTPVWITGFEHGVVPTSSGSGLATNISGSPAIDSTIKNTGNYSLKIVATGGGTACNVRKNHIPTNIQTAVARAYIYIPTGGLPSANSTLVGWQIVTAATTVGFNVSTGGLARAQVGSGTAVVGPSITLDAWHRVDIKVIITGTTWTMDWSFDGVAQTQATLAGQATNDSLQGLRLGSSSTTATYTAYFDDVILSETGADYPIGPGGTELLVPDGAGTSNAGTNVMEEANGTDANSSSYQALNSVPMGNSTNYIKQSANGNSNYIGVTFGNIVSNHSSIIGAMALLAYTSATTTSNTGGCIVSKDAFSSFTTLWGQQSALADYSDGSTGSPFWKSAIIAGAVDDSTVNALEARLGYSDDTSPNPYWLDIGVEVAYVPSNSISLDLVTYSSNVPAVNVIENTVISLDTGIYSSSVPSINVTENTVILLDRVIYSNSIPAVTIIENVVIDLDLVTYSTSNPDIIIVGNVVIDLDLVTYSSDNLDIDVLENIVTTLESITFDSSINDLLFLEDERILLDLVDYTSYVQDLNVIEDTIVPLELVSYSSSVLDAVLMAEETISVESISYSIVVYDLVVLENEIILLEEVSYSSTVPDMVFLENEVILLDLISISVVVHNAFLVSDSSLVKVPLNRTYTIEEISSVISIERQNRNFAIERQERIIY